MLWNDRRSKYLVEGNKYYSFVFAGLGMCPERETLAQGSRQPWAFYRPGSRHLIRPDDRKLAPGWWQQLGHNFGHRFPGAAGQRFGHEILEQAGGKVKKRLFKICYYFTW